MAHKNCGMFHQVLHLEFFVFKFVTYQTIVQIVKSLVTLRYKNEQRSFDDAVDL